MAVRREDFLASGASTTTTSPTSRTWTSAGGSGSSGGGSSRSRGRSPATAAARRARRSASSRAASSSRRTPSRPPTRTSTTSTSAPSCRPCSPRFVGRVSEMLDSRNPGASELEARSVRASPRRGVRAAAASSESAQPGRAAVAHRGPADDRAPAGAPLDPPQPRRARRQAHGRSRPRRRRSDSEIFAQVPAAARADVSGRRAVRLRFLPGVSSRSRRRSLRTTLAEIFA